MQQDISVNNKRIAKNTLFLYFRMIVILAISLYTSRVVLAILGVEDYGIYNVVGGVVTLLSFLNAALSNGSSRFITYEMGKRTEGNVKKVFQSSFIAHLILALAIIVIAETIGLWFVYNKLVISPERLGAAVFTYHCSIITSFITITQVPYTALIISNEKMGIYAYISILEAILKLFVVFLLIYSPMDKLEYYAVLLCVVQIGIALVYRIYCIRNYNEASLKRITIDLKKIKEIVFFSSWSLFGNAAHALNGQGLTIVTNMFFNPTVVAARALSIQVNTAVMHLIQNLGTAANPQIVKLYSAGEIKKSQSLLLNIARYSFLMMLFVSVPLICACKEVLGIWLVEVPDYTVIFVQLILIQSLFFTFDSCLYIGLYACGRVKENALISPTLYIIQFFVIYLLFSWGYSPVALSVVGIITCAIAGVIVKPVLLYVLAGYSIKDVYMHIGRCVFAAILSFSAPLMVMNCFADKVWGTILKVVIGMFTAYLAIWCLGINKDERNRAICVIKNKMHV